MKVALIGCGAIGTLLAHAIDEGKVKKVSLVWVYDIKPEKSEALVKKLRSKPKVASGASQIFADKSVDLIIEAASQSAVKQYSFPALQSGKDLMVMSVGAFSDDKLFRKLKLEAERHGRRIYIPSGAVLGIDGVKASKLGKICEVVLTTRKPPAAFEYSEYLKAHRIRITGLRKPKVIFDGPARKAVAAFPASVNVAATLSLAGVGFDKTRVRIIADPKIKINIHEIRVRGESGEFLTEARNVPFPDVPRTSYQAALSAIRTLNNLSDTVRVGT